MLSALLFLASCAVSPEAEERQRAMEEEIEAILSEPLAGEPERCLADHEYRSFRAIDDRRILFEGRRGELWLNTLRTRCPDLRHSSVLVVRSIYTMRGFLPGHRLVRLALVPTLALVLGMGLGSRCDLRPRRVPACQRSPG
jgi:hypothetical protein